jgi:two-component system OmpR family response regulator
MSRDEPILRVLCVDDNRDAADTLGVLLDIYGYSPHVCYDGPSALTAADDFQPDLAIIDLSMPGMDGDEVGRRLRSTGWGVNLPLIALTALSGDDARARTTAAGFDLHLTKPVDPDRLMNVLADVVILRRDAYSVR